jgi:3-methyl-2-oxobutanoate hydroxymethyltransferase
VAGEITGAGGLPTIGIGAGPQCDGQVLVTNDLLGVYDKFVPRFVKQYCRLAPQIKEALAGYVREVEDGTFPGPEHSFAADGGELKKLY